MMKGRVFCQNCKHHYYPNIDGGSIYHYCRFFFCRFFRALDYGDYEPECDEINKYNRCENYEEKRWMLFRVKENDNEARG